VLLNTITMKKLILIATMAVLSIGAFAQDSWRWGLTLGTADNSSRFSGGMTQAAAVFNAPAFGGSYLGVNFIKTYCPHFSIEFGLKAITYGFQYDIAQNYSLTNFSDRGTVNKAPIGALNAPITALYTSKYNCANVRWFGGLGLSLTMGGQQKDIVTSSNTADQVTNNSTTPSYISQDVHYAPVMSPEGHFTFGIERLFRCGRMLSLGLFFNRGLTPIASSNVTYTANNQIYQHTFTNYGNYSGLTLSYFFRPFGVAKAIPAGK
jgi:hypothetical protein